MQVLRTDGVTYSPGTVLGSYEGVFDVLGAPTALTNYGFHSLFRHSLGTYASGGVLGTTWRVLGASWGRPGVPCDFQVIFNDFE